VHPGPVVYFCPNEAGFRIGPRSTAQARGSGATGTRASSWARPPQGPRRNMQLPGPTSWWSTGPSRSPSIRSRA